MTEDPSLDKIIDTFMDGHELDIQWGNHDVLWMGAASGSAACMANVIRICARYNNLEIIEDAYGISLRPLITFAEMVYKEDRYDPFMPKINTEDESKIFPEELRQIAKMNQAISIIQFKLEGEIIKRHPEFDMADRMVLDFIDYEKGTVKLDGKEYPLLCDYFPTVDPADPYRLTEEEILVVERLMTGFLNSERLQKHVQFLFSKGSMYLSYNDNLLFHGCVPLNPDGSFMEMAIANVKYSGKALLDKYEEVLRRGYLNREATKHNIRSLDLVWYLWEGKASSLFGKDKMTTFERLYVADKETHRREEESVLRAARQCGTVLQNTEGIRPGSKERPYHQWPHACQRKNRRESVEGGRQTDRHRRRLFESLPEYDRACRLYAALQLLRDAAGFASAVHFPSGCHRKRKGYRFDPTHRRQGIGAQNGKADGCRQEADPTSHRPAAAAARLQIR